MSEQVNLNIDKQYDVAIVGGGVYGAVLANECARCGFTTVLIEKDDFCQSTSANSLNIIHGGLRYLQHMDIRRMRRSINSRRYFQQIAAAHIDSVPFITPLSGWGINGLLFMRTALLLNDLIGFDRNKGIARSEHLPAGRVLSRKRLLEQLPEFRGSATNGAALWYEAVMNNPWGVINELLSAAARHGAALVKHTEVKRLTIKNGRISGLSCYSQGDEKELLIQCSIVIDTTGKTPVKLGSSLPGYQPIKQYWARAVNMVIDKCLFNNYAVGLKYTDNVRDKQAKMSSGNRYLFFVPHQKGSAIGTFYEAEDAVNGSLNVSDADQQRYLDAVNSVLPANSIEKENIIDWQCGWLPVDDDSGEELNFIKSSHIRAVEADGHFSGLIEVNSVKFTTAPAVAKDVIKLLRSVS